MKRMSNLLSVLAILGGLMLAGCTQTLKISKVDYSQPVETVLVPNSEGVVTDAENNIQFNILPLQYAETQDTASVTTEEIRMIRGSEGYYYITASGYQNVYVMAPERSSLKLKKKITISKEGLQNPVFNQRKPYVQLLNRATGESYALTNEGIAKPKKNVEEQEVN